MFSSLSHVWSFWDPFFLLPQSWQPQLYPNTPRIMLSLLQAEYRLCNGSDKECTSPTTRISKKDALKVGLAQGKDRGDTHTPYILLSPCLVANRGSGAVHALHDPRLLWSQAQKENYRQEKKRATKQLFSALTDPSVVIMADSLKVGKCHSQRLLSTGTSMALGRQV